MGRGRCALRHSDRLVGRLIFEVNIGPLFELLVRLNRSRQIVR